ncbi:MAG: ComEC family competence protein [Synergistaceae bacterium]|jgi:competence protein ComEC|nr:ComEC family competence protein [Synergistaceae bacterium]
MMGLENAAGIPRSSPLGRAPAFALLINFSLAVFLAEDVGFPFWAAAVLSVTAAAGWFFIGTERPPKSSLPVVAALLAFSLAGMSAIYRGISQAEIPPGKVDATGVVISERKWGWRRIAVVRTGVRRFVVRYGGGASPGDIVRFSGRLEPFKRSGANREFDEFKYWKAKGTSAAVDANRFEVVGRSEGIAFRRDALAKRIKNRLPRLTAGYIAAAWVGERDDELNNFHRNAGTSHLLVVSGLHVGIVAAICMAVTRRLPFRFFIASAVMWFYALLSGAAPSSVRAALMIQTAIIGRASGQRSGAFNGVSAAAALMLAYNPRLFWDMGWRLSVLSVLTLASVQSLGVGPSAKWLAASPAVWLITSVQSAWTFGAVPLAGAVINFFAVPVFSILLPAASLLAVPSLAGADAGRYAAMWAESAFLAWERFSDNMTRLIPWSTDFSPPLMFSGAASAIFLFARACGFSNASAAAALGFNMLLFALYNL